MANEIITWKFNKDYICNECQEKVCMDCKLVKFRTVAKNKTENTSEGSTSDIFSQFTYCTNKCVGIWEQSVLFCQNCSFNICLHRLSEHNKSAKHRFVTVSEATVESLQSFCGLNEEISGVENAIKCQLKQCYEQIEKAEICKLYQEVEVAINHLIEEGEKLREYFRCRKKTKIKHLKKKCKFLQKSLEAFHALKGSMENVKIQNPPVVAFSQVVSQIEIHVSRLLAIYKEKNIPPKSMSAWCFEPRPVTKEEIMEFLGIFLNRSQLEFDDSNKDKMKATCTIHCTDTSCKEQREKYLSSLSDKNNTIDTLQKRIKALRKDLKSLSEQKENIDGDFKRTKEDFEHSLLERDELKKRFSKRLVAGQTITDNLRQTISSLQEELRRHKAETVIKLDRTEKATELLKLERDEVKKRAENLLDTVESLTKQQNALQNENTWLRTRLQDIKINFKEWENISLKVASALNPLHESSYDVEKENETLKETLKKVENDKQRLEHELSITLNKLIKSREECNGISKRYSKNTHDMETNTIAEASTNEINKCQGVGEYHDEDNSLLQCRGEENTSITMVEKSTNEQYRKITSTLEKNIYQITASNVYMIDKSTVSGIGFSSSIQGSDCKEPLQENEPLEVDY